MALFSWLEQKASTLASDLIPGLDKNPKAGASAIGPLADTHKNKYLLNSYYYPENIGQNVSEGHLYPHAVKFTVFVPVTDTSAVSNSLPNTPVVSAINTAAATTTFAAIKNRKQIDTTISLYMPDTVTQSYDAAYDDTSLKEKKLTMLGQGAATVLNKVFNNEKTISVIDTLLAGASGSKYNQYLPTEAVLQARGFVLNPNVQLLFRAVALRQFQFEFMFSPRNSNESVAIQNIISTFKFHAAPEIVGSFNEEFLNSNYNIAAGLAFIIPSSFTISFLYRDPNGNWLPNPAAPTIGECVLESINVDHAPNGWSTFTDGNPTQIRLTLQFKETSIITKSEVAAGF